MPYEVSTPVFAGPFDLLLHLILRDEVELWDVPLAAIVDSYIAELDRMESLDLEVATEFLLIAATLVELKARRLLPGPDDVDLDEELILFEERDLLLARLLECKTFQDAARALESRMRAADRSVPRRAGPEAPYCFLVPDPLEAAGLAAFAAAAARALAPKDTPVVNLDHIAPVRASVREAAIDVLRLLPDHEPMSFRALVAAVESRLELVVRFLAVLELYKQGMVDVEQFASFDELLVRRLAADERAAELGRWDDWDDPSDFPADDDAGIPPRAAPHGDAAQGHSAEAGGEADAMEAEVGR